MSLQPQPNTNNTNHKQTPSPATLRNPYVKSDTIQSSFQSLTTETDQYRQATQEATTERHALQERLQACRQEIQTRADEIRAAQDTLGGATREISLWRRQEANLRDKVLRERQILEELTHTIQTLEGTVKNDRYDFCRTMAELNHELGRHLRAHEETRLTSFLHPATADGVLMTHENSGEEEGGDATNNPHNNHGPDDSPARDEHRAIQAALVALHEAAGVYQDVSAQQENCSQRIDALRRRILAEGKRTATAAAASRDKSVADEDEATRTEQGWIDLDESRTDGDEAMLWTEQGLYDMEDAWVKDWEENPPASLYSESPSEGEDSEMPDDDSEMQDDDGASVTH